MAVLNDYEFDITRELFSIALANAADAFSKMSNEKVMLKGFEAHFIEGENIPALVASFASDEFYVLGTEIKGKMRGKTYFLLQRQDIQTLFKIFAPPAVHQIASDGQLSDIQQDILLELDNILSAAVVTQIANFLEVFIYGDIPKYHLKAAASLQTQLLQDVGSLRTVMHIRTQFQSYHTNMSPSFLCFFEDELVAVIREMIATKQDKILQKIRASKEGKS